MSLEAKTEFVLIIGPNSNRQSSGLILHPYLEEILQELVMAFSGFIGKNFIFIHDNARRLTAAVARQYLEEVDLRVMVTPARRPEPNPVEHLRASNRN